LKKLGPNESIQGWEYLQPTGDYAQLIYKQVEELVQAYKLDGVWFDIINPYRLNYNTHCVSEMKAKGLDVDNVESVTNFSNEQYHLFMKTATEIVKKHQPNATVFFNGTTATYTTANAKTFKFNFFQYNTKHDLEDLPTAWGGYDIFPYRSKYFLNTGKEIVAMSGKFHKAWGEFGGFKDKEALKYEAASMIAFGAACNFGDQLHPSGLMDMTTYENIGYAFDYVEIIEEYGIGGTSISETGLYIGEDVPANEGMTQMLVEKQINFDVVNTLTDWSKINVLILTSDGVLPSDVAKVREFVERGGKVLAMGDGVFVNGKPIIPIGASYIGKANFDVDYTVVGKTIVKGLVASPFLNYSPALRILPDAGTEVLASIREPYFSRTKDHYCSHANTPYTMSKASHPAVVRKGNVVYLAHNLDKQYHKEGARLHRDLFYNCLQLLRTAPMVETKMPSMGRMNLLHQPHKNRYVVHLLYASPIQRGSVRVIEDIVPLMNIPVVLDVPEKVKSAYMIPSGKRLNLTKTGDVVKIIIPEFTMHTGVVFQY
jgi:hypothetical protein